MHRSDGHEMRLTDGDQGIRDHLCGCVRFGLIGCFLQIETGAKSRARAAQNNYPLLRFLRSHFDRGAQFSE